MRGRVKTVSIGTSMLGLNGQLQNRTSQVVAWEMRGRSTWQILIGGVNHKFSFAQTFLMIFWYEYFC
ncbi:hypothetical protein SLA2020_235640 [Shorea laevis]